MPPTGLDTQALPQTSPLQAERPQDQRRPCTPLALPLTTGGASPGPRTLPAEPCPRWPSRRGGGPAVGAPPPPPWARPRASCPQPAYVIEQNRACRSGPSHCQQGLLPSGVDLCHLHPLCPGVTPAHGPAEPPRSGPRPPLELRRRQWGSAWAGVSLPGKDPHPPPSRGDPKPRGDWRTAKCSTRQGDTCP